MADLQAPTVQFVAWLRRRLRDSVRRSAHRLGRSRRAMIAAALLRNQSQVVIAAHLAPSGEPEENGENWLLELIGERIGRFVDVGANVGEWSRQVLHVAPDATGILVEPGTSALEHLRAAFGQESRVEIVEGAAGEQAGSAVFYEGPGADVRSSLVLRPDSAAAVARTVSVHTLDDLLGARGWDGADILKIDAEGYDAHVLAGAARLLERQSIGLVQFEYNMQWAWAGSTLARALRLLEAAGYRVFALRPNSLLPINYALLGDFFGYANFVGLAPRCIPWVSDHFEDAIAWSAPPVGLITPESSGGVLPAG